MSVSKEFFAYVAGKLEAAANSEEEAIRKAASLIVRSHRNGKEFYAFGSGHSHIITEEIYGRAGGLGFVRPMLPTELMVLEFPEKSTFIERLDGYASGLLDQYELQEGDTILIISNSGRNPVPVEMALEAKKRGASVIALTSLDHSRNCTSRHSSGKKLYEIADVVLNNQAPKGDAGFYVDGCDHPVGPVSDIIGSAIAQALVAEVVFQLGQEGENAPVFVSSNLDEGDAMNKALFHKYYGYRR